MKSKISKIFSRLLVAALGVLLIIYPDTALVTVIRFIGVAILIIGIVGVITYIAAPIKGIITTMIFILAILTILVSFIPIMKPNLVVAIFPFVIGIAIVINGIVNIVESIALKAATGIWFVPMLLSLLTIAAGCFIAFYPFETVSLLVRIVGVIVVYSAIVGLFTAFKSKPVINADGTIDITNSN